MKTSVLDIPVTGHQVLFSRTGNSCSDRIIEQEVRCQAPNGEGQDTKGAKRARFGEGVARQ